MERPSVSGVRTGGRILGIDVARALAIVGMLAVHVGPTDAGGLLGRLYAASHGRASVLFVLVAGIGVSLLAASRRRSLTHARAELGWRSLLLLGAGLALQELDHRVLVILQTYALLFLLGAATLRWPDRWLLTAAAALAVLGPLTFLAGLGLAPGTFDRDPVRLGDGPWGMAHGLFLSGSYPLVVWAVPFLLGLWLGRRDLSAVRSRAALMAGGGAVALVSPLARILQGRGELEGWARLLDASPHSQMPLWLVGSCGAAALVLGASLALARRWPRLAWPAAAMGQLALSVYVAHLLVLHGWGDVVRSDSVARAAVVVAAFSVLAALASSAWRALLPRGPLEALLRLPPSR